MELLRELDLAKGQELTPFKQQYAENDNGVLEAGLGVLLVIVCGSLIIYNILSLSAAQDIRFFGQLKTLGVTKRQLKSYMRYQIWWLCLLGVPGGFALAVPLSAFVVPQAVMLFFTLDGLLSGYSASALVGNSMYYDIVVEGVNGSFSEQTLREVAAIPGVESMEEMRMLKPQSSEADWLKVSEPKLQTYCDKVRADRMIGIGQQEFARISEACGMEADKEAFQSGAVGIWLCNTFEDDEQPLMPQDAQTVYLGVLEGQKVTIPKMERVACTSSMLLLMQEVAPNILVSNDVLRAAGITGTVMLIMAVAVPLMAYRSIFSKDRPQPNGE